MAKEKVFLIGSISFYLICPNGKVDTWNGFKTGLFERLVLYESRFSQDSFNQIHAASP